MRDNQELSFLKVLADWDSQFGSSKQLKIRVFLKFLFTFVEATAALSERSSYFPLSYSTKNMLSSKEKYSDWAGGFQAWLLLKFNQN